MTTLTYTRGSNGENSEIQGLTGDDETGITDRLIKVVIDTIKIRPCKKANRLLVINKG